MKNVKTVLKAIVAASFLAAVLVAFILALHLSGRKDSQSPELPRGMSEIIDPLLPDPREDTPDSTEAEDAAFPELPHRGDPVSPKEPPSATDPD